LFSDPNYQTLAGMDAGVFGADKAVAPAGGSTPAAPKPPTQGGMGKKYLIISSNIQFLAGTHDPNYQTLAGMDAGVFGADKAKPAGGGGGAAPAAPKTPAQGGIGNSLII
jgi:hypothetical protein